MTTITDTEELKNLSFDLGLVLARVRDFNDYVKSCINEYAERVVLTGTDRKSGAVVALSYEQVKELLSLFCTESMATYL